MKSRIHSIIAPMTIILVLLMACEPLLWAHAILLEAVPAKDATVEGPDITIRLKFNSRVDGPRSKIFLVLPDKSVRTLSPDKQKSLELLDATASGLKPGRHKIRWQVLAADGHITRGEYAFVVK